MYGRGSRSHDSCAHHITVLITSSFLAFVIFLSGMLYVGRQTPMASLGRTRGAMSFTYFLHRHFLFVFLFFLSSSVAPPRTPTASAPSISSNAYDLLDCKRFAKRVMESDPLLPVPTRSLPSSTSSSPLSRPSSRASSSCSMSCSSRPPTRGRPRPGMGPRGHSTSSTMPFPSSSIHPHPQ